MLDGFSNKHRQLKPRRIRPVGLCHVARGGALFS
jgi:hypothetical protein